jgi:hypothetical protein
MMVHAKLTRATRRLPPMAGSAMNSRKKRSASGGMVAAGHSASHSTNGSLVYIAMKVDKCQADTMKVKAANAV